MATTQSSSCFSLRRILQLIHTEGGDTALMLASQNGHDAVVRLLLSHHDIVINTQAQNGGTALLAASESGHDPIVKLLLSHSDVAVNTPAQNGWTALMVASQNGHDEVVKAASLSKRPRC
jgi:ankyrin repeat protein